MTITQFLREHVSIFEGIHPDLAHSMARRIEQKVFKKGQTVLFRGSTVDGLHVVASGKVSVHAKGQSGGAPVKVADLGPGEVLGEISIVNHGTAGATVRCDEDDTTIFVLPQNAFKAIMTFNPDVEERTRSLIAKRKAELAAATGSRRPA